MHKSPKYLLNLWSCTVSMAGDPFIVRRKAKAGSWPEQSRLALRHAPPPARCPLGWPAIMWRPPLQRDQMGKNNALSCPIQFFPLPFPPALSYCSLLDWAKSHAYCITAILLFSLTPHWENQEILKNKIIVKKNLNITNASADTILK